MNNRHESIKFTFEIESGIDNTLPFLDLNLKRVDQKIEFGIYRKSATTDRYITIDSYCTHQNKIATFNSMVYRLCRLPLSVSEYMKEYKHILHLADINGFKKSLVDNLVRKHANNLNRDERTTLFTQNKTLTPSNDRRITMTFAPDITNNLRHTFERANMKIVHTNNNKIRFMLDSTKDTIPLSDRSGIYEIKCNKCDKKYIGQTKRAIYLRYTEHLRHIYDLDNTELHSIGDFDNNVRMIKNVNNPFKLDAYESLSSIYTTTMSKS